MKAGRGLLPLIALVPIVPLLQKGIDDRLGGFRAQDEVLYLRSGNHVRRLCPGFENLMADVYWLRTVQYFGGQRAFADEKRFDLLEPLVDITTTLDPRLEIAYRYGAIFLAEHRPLGAGRPEAAVALLERGVRHLPNSWLIRQNLGFFIFLFLDDAKRASEALLAARGLPGAPHWLETLAADLLRRGGERSMSRQIWQRMYEQAEEGPIKANALVQLQYLDALDAIGRLSAVALAFEQRTGRAARSLAELQAFGLPFPPVDPTGTPFDYDPQTGSFSVARRSKIWRAP